MSQISVTVNFFKKLWPFRTVEKATSVSESHERLQANIGYRFRDKALLRHALTHKSAVNLSDRKGLSSNERLEFLGDSVLNCLVTEHLYEKYPDQTEGHLAKLKSLIVSRKILGEVGDAIHLGRYCRLGASERKAGVKGSCIVSNAFEAVCGAIYLDGGLESVRELLRKFLFCRIEEFLNDADNVNYKSTILEMSQRDGFGMPHYNVLSTSGPEHDKIFVIELLIGGVSLGQGTGANKKIAQQNAAQSAVEHYNPEYILSQKERIIQHEHELVSD
jgi:ribonuclease-3